MYVKQKDLVPIEWPISEYEIRAAYPDSSLPEYISDELSFELGYGPYVYNGYPSEYNPEWQNIEEIAPLLIDGKYQQTYKITEKYTPEEKKKLQDEQAKEDNKSRAEQLLQQTDWTATVDISNPQYSNPYLATQDAFLAYRSQLRAIAVNPPVVADWPVKPNEVWTTV
jgi:hypothetical protein